MRAIILAGGQGRRLAPYTTVLPKPLMPIGEIPILEIVERQLKHAGFDDITLAVGIDFSASHNINFLGELYAKKSYSGSIDRIEPRFGYRIRMGENLFTTAGAGLDIRNSSPEFRLWLTVSYFLSPEKKKIKRIEEIED